MRRIALLLVTTLLALWVAPPLVMERLFESDTLLTVRVATLPAALWFAIAVLVTVGTSLALGWEWGRMSAGQPPRAPLWAAIAMTLAALWVGIPLLDRGADIFRPPLITLVSAQDIVPIWFVVALAGTLLLLITLGWRLHRMFNLRQREHRLQTIVREQIEEGVALLDRKMRLQWHNDVAERQFVKGESVEAAVAQLARHARDMGKVATQSMTVDESRVIVQALPLPNGDIGIISRAQANENGANNDFYERFMRRIVHDMRNPLAAIIAHASNLQTAPDFERASATRTAQTIETEAQRLTRLVDGILFDARLSHMPLVLARLDMRDVLEEVYYQQDERAEREGKAIEFETPPQPMPLDGDRDLLVRAIANLVDNALKYSGAGATVRLVGELSPGHTVVKVIDNGEGIPPEFLPDRIFEALVRVRAREGVSGSGLGLNIVKKIVQMHGGTIMADSTLGQGTTMTMLLPRGE
jgi:two-component system, OmpR family, phosphate regulon sensor histidine kinase PhoR